MERRVLFAWLTGLPLFAFSSVSGQETPRIKKLKIMMKVRGARMIQPGHPFAFVHGLALAEAGHDVQIFPTGEATYTVRKATVDEIKPVGGRR